MRISKKILAGVLAALMAISMMPFTALGLEGSGQDSSNTPGPNPAIPSLSTTYKVATGAELKTAVANAVNGDVIEFDADSTTYPATSGALVIPVDGKDITIDLKGHTQYFRVSGETTVSYPTDLFVLKNDAKLTVKDSVGGGAIYATYGANSSAYIFNVLDSSDLVIDGGTYVMDAANYGGVIVYQNSADASTTINDGTFTANTGAKARRDYLINNTRGDVEINGGTFSTPRAFDYVVNAGNTADTNVSINDGDFNGTLSGTKGKLVINGGTFNTFDGAVYDVSNYLAEDAVQGADGSVTNGYVAKVGSDYYETLEEAIAAANAGDTITLVGDTTLATTDININKNLTIDFATYTVTAARWPFINRANLTLEGTTGGLVSSRGLIDNYGTLTVNGGVYNNTAIPNPAIWNNPGSTVVINGGTIDSNNADVYNEAGTLTINGGVLNSASSYKVSSDAYCYAVRNLPGSSCTMNGGTINAVHGGIAAYGDDESTTTTVVVNDGTITTHNSEAGNDAFYPLYVSGNGTSMTVNGGTFSGPRSAAMIDDDDIGLTENTALTITGGNFTSPSGVAAVTCGQNNSIPVISGGTFSSDVTAYLANGYIQDQSTGEVYANNAVDTMSITVEDNIDLNIYVADPTNEIETITYSYNGAADKQQGYEEVSKTVAAKKNADGKINLSVDLAPAQIMDNITVVKKNAAGETVGEPIETSVADYCNTIISSTGFTTEMKDLAKSTLDYGKAASDYFSYNTSAYAGYVTKLADPTSAINAISYDSNEYAGGIYAMNKVSYVATSTPELRFYLMASSGHEQNLLAAANADITCNIGTAKFVKDGANNFILQIKGIDITDFGKQIEVKVGDTTVVKYTPIHWVKAAIVSGDINLENLGKGIGNYYLKSVAYFGENA